MTASSRATWSLWRRIRRRPGKDIAYAIYLACMLAVCTIAPVAHLVWVLLTDAVGGARVVEAVRGPFGGFAIGMLWCSSVVVGRARGPVVLEPFLASILVESPIRGRAAFAGVMVRALVVGGVLGSAVAGVVGVVSTGSIVAAAPAVFASVLCGAGVGVLTAVLWLVGQALPTSGVASVAAALTIASIASMTLGGGAGDPLRQIASAVVSPFEPFVTIAIAVAAVLAVAAVPLLLDRVHPTTIREQSQQWARASAGASVLDVGAVTASYRALPRRGRSWSAVRPRRAMTGVILTSDVVAAFRTPWSLTLAAAFGVLAGFVAAASTTNPDWGLAGAALAGMLVFAASGACTRGAQHAAEAMGGPPLYGISTTRLLLMHALFPVLALTMLTAIGGGIAAATTSAAASTPVTIVLLAPGVLAVALCSMLKESLPPSLLTPVPTPLGDIGALARMLWALDGVLLAAFVGIAAVAAVRAPWMLLAIAVLVATLFAVRLRRR